MTDLEKIAIAIEHVSTSIDEHTQAIFSLCRAIGGAGQSVEVGLNDLGTGLAGAINGHAKAEAKAAE